MTTSVDRLERFQVVASEGFADWLDASQTSIAFARHDQLVLVGLAPTGELRVDVVDSAPVGALALDGRTLWAATVFQVWRFEDGLAQGATSDCGQDAVFLPQAGATTGGIQIADMAVSADGPVIASHRFSCLGALADGLSFRPLWLPRWVSALAPEERSPVSGVEVRDGRVAFASLLGCGDGAPGAGWRQARATGGALVDVGTDEIIANGLSMPFSPTWHGDRLWFTQAGTGELCVVEPDDSVSVVATLPTFLRGLAFVGPHAVVAGSGSRSDALLEGLPIGDRLLAQGQRPEQGLFVIDVRSGEIVHRLAIEGTGREIPALVALTGIRRPALLAPTDGELQSVVAYDRDWEGGR